MQRSDELMSKTSRPQLVAMVIKVSKLYNSGMGLKRDVARAMVRITKETVMDKH